MHFLHLNSGSEAEEIEMEVDDDLSRFEADGAPPLPQTEDEGYVEREGAWIWYATYGVGAPVILLHGGLGHSIARCPGANQA